MPERFAAYGETWRVHHPGWEIIDWTAATLPPLHGQAAFARAAGTPTRQADLARYELLAVRGGVYVDCDMECRRSIEPLLDGVHAFAAREDERIVNIAILGAVPGHPLFALAAAEAVRRIAALPGAPVNEQTGPVMFTELVETLGPAADLVVFGPERFYPYHYSEPERAAGPFPDAYAVHHWEHSWSDELDGLAETFRVAVVVDPADPDTARPALAAYAALFGPLDAVELALVVAGDAASDAPVLSALIADHGVPGEVTAYAPDELAGEKFSAIATSEPRSLAEALARLALLRKYLDGRAMAPPRPVTLPS